MVIISHTGALALQAYSTAHLTLEMKRTVQHGFYNGTYARFGDPQATVTIHDRPDFHARSHYDIRNILDSEGMEDTFLLIDEKTPELDAIWLVKPTSYSRAEEEDEQPGDVIHHPGETFTLWHGHIRTADVPTLAVIWSIGCGDLTETLYSEDYHPYDPHDPQDRPINLTIDWADPQVAGSEWGHAYLTATSGSEVEWSTDIALRQEFSPEPPAVARLTAEAARESGLRQYWSYQERIIPPGGSVSLTAPYDTESPIWPIGFPDDDPSEPAMASGARFRADRRPSQDELLLISTTQQRAQENVLQAKCRRVELQKAGDR
ncbi:MAG: hypothetical protein Q9176_004962 [Flavoplaca citrina]